METSEASTCALAMAPARLLGISYTGGSLWTPGALLRGVGDKALAQATQRLWGLLHGDLQQPPGHGPVHFALGGPAGDGVGLRDPEGPASLSHSGILKTGWALIFALPMVPMVSLLLSTSLPQTTVLLLLSLCTKEPRCGNTTVDVSAWQRKTSSCVWISVWNPSPWVAGEPWVPAGAARLHATPWQGSPAPPCWSLPGLYQTVLFLT